MQSRILTLTKLSFKEMISKKIVWGITGITILILLVIILVFNVFDVDEILPVINKKKNNQQTNIYDIAATFFRTAVSVPMYIGGIFLSIFTISTLIPTILEKGTIDFFLSRPIKRYEIILGEFLGGSLMVLANIIFLIFGTWILIGFFLGNWEVSFLFVIPLTIVTFLDYFALIILFGVLWQNSISAMMMSYIIFFVLGPILENRDVFIISLDGKAWEYSLNTLYYIFPQSHSILELTTLVTTSELRQINLAELNYLPVFITFLQSFIYLGLAIFVFRKKDY